MRDVLNPTTTKNAVGMLRNYDDKAILILEGKTDRLTLSDFINRATCRILVATNKTEAIEAVEWADLQRFDGIIGVVDSDLVDIVEARSVSQNVVYTDNYDLDALVFFSKGIIERCVEHLCNYDRFSEEDEGDGTFRGVREKSAAMAHLIGCFRLYSIMDGYHIPLDKFPFGEIYRGPTLALDATRLRAIAGARFKQAAVSDPISVLDGWLARAALEQLPAERLARGHDLFSCLGLVISSEFGTNHKGETWESFARSHLKLVHVRASGLYKRVLDWCEQSGKVVWGV